MKSSVLALSLLALLAGCHGVRGGERPKIVEAEGWAPCDPSDAPRTKRRALAEAQRAALEKANGIELAARTRLSLSVEVEQRIQTRARGVIERYQIIAEREEGGMHETRILAWVRRTAEGDDAALVLPPPGDPKVLVAARDANRLGDRSALGLRKGLSSRGVSLIGDGLPDVKVLVAAQVRALDGADLAGLASYRASVSAEAVDVKTGRILAQASREASAVDLLPSGAADKAVEQAGASAGRELAAALSASLEGR